MIYMWALARKKEYEGVRFDGEVVYSLDHVEEIPSARVDEEFVKNMVGLIARIGNTERPARRVPSVSECGFCRIPKDNCPERIEEGEADATTDEF